MRRVFIALPIPEKIALGLLPLQTGLDNARYSPHENFHITLRFLGDLSEDIIEDLDNEIAQIEIAQFTLSLSGIGFFGGENPHSIHAIVNECPELLKLHSKIDAICNKMNIAKDHKKYTPHVTLAYMKNGADLLDVINYQTRHSLFKSKKWVADSFKLYASHLGKGASVYEDLAQYPLLNS
jgi:RNA 2',3'-cyclic 3'-phosphodiesterase